jgi:hypothetical protein
VQTRDFYLTKYVAHEIVSRNWWTISVIFSVVWMPVQSVSGVHQIGDDDVSAIKDRTACFPQVHTPGSRNQRIEFAANAVDLAITNDFSVGGFLITATMDNGDIWCPS